MLRTEYAGHQSYHPADFIYHRDSSQVDWQIIHTLTHAEFLINDTWTYYPENQIIIYPPNTEGAYRACCDTGFGNNWVSFYTNEKYITHSMLPSATPFTVNAPEIIDYIMHMIAAENFFENEYREQSINYLFHLLYNKFHESCNVNTTTLSQDLVKLRFNISNNPAYPWTVPLMAQMLNISTGYLHVMYKQTFGISCMDDVYNNRIELAKDYIAHSRYSIGQIAELCGYQNKEHFCRQFKKITGMTATTYKMQYMNLLQSAFNIKALPFSTVVIVQMGV